MPSRLIFAVLLLIPSAIAPAQAEASAGEGVAGMARPPWGVLRQIDAAGLRRALEGRPLEGDAAAPPADGLPDGGVARAGAGDIRAAWYGAPTRRYRHAVLGDDIEAGRLVVQTAEGATLAHDLPETDVFEDITPRLADLDGDGLTEVVTIRSSLRLGASVAIYGVVDGRLALRAATPFIGRAHRWLNIAGIADYLGEGGAQIAFVETPHIGGTLHLWSFGRGALTPRAALGGFSNHAIGSRVQALSVTVDLNADGRPELIVPDDRRRVLRVMAAGAGGWCERGRVAPGGRVAGLAIAGADPAAASAGEGRAEAGARVEDGARGFVSLSVLLDDGAALVGRVGVSAGDLPAGDLPASDLPAGAKESVSCP